jgi:hypothetical protein
MRSSIANDEDSKLGLFQLRKTVDFTIVRLELLQSEVFSNGGGERTQLLTSFCDYQARLNPGEDTHPEHWDIG